MSKLFEELLDIEQFGIVEPFIRISEQAEAQKIQGVQQEQAMAQTMTPSGMTPEDSDESFA